MRSEAIQGSQRIVCVLVKLIPQRETFFSGTSRVETDVIDTSLVGHFLGIVCTTAGKVEPARPPVLRSLRWYVTG
jgi:hypothetical protein